MLSTLTSKGGLSATTALVACGFLFLTPTGQNMWMETDVGPSGLLNVNSDDITALEAGDVSDGLEDQIELITTEELSADGASAEAPFDILPPEPAPEALVVPSESQDKAFIKLAEEAPAKPTLAPPLPSVASPEMLVPQRDQRRGPRTLRILTDSLSAQSRAIAPTGNTSQVPSLGGLDSNTGSVLVQPGTETFANAESNPLKVTSEDPVSTFSIDVDTASYAMVRNTIMRGQLPDPDAVRVEEMINYFPYDYAAPETGGDPFQPTVGVMQTPWNAETQLVHIALQGELPVVEDRPALNLVFLIDTSGSMADITKLPLLKQSFLLMLDQLRPEDEVAIVEYAGSAGQVLAPTPASNRAAIRNALNGLGAGGSTNGQGGLEQAYAVAETMTKDGEVSRVLLATDGDFNVGLSDPGGLEDFIAKKRETGTFLSILGFGRGNLNDQTMQTLAQNGNGTAAYIDTLSEAQKVLVDQLTGALFPIASDVKVQIEFDPSQIAEYRLIGYETRALKREDFNNDAVDAGDLGAGHTVTALYEVTPVGSPARLTDPLRYGAQAVLEERDELGFVKLRYKEPGADSSQLIETPILRDSAPSVEASFATAIAGFGQILRGTSYLGEWSMGDAIDLATDSKGADPYGYRAEAIQLMRLAESLSRD